MKANRMRRDVADGLAGAGYFKLAGIVLAVLGCLLTMQPVSRAEVNRPQGQLSPALAGSRLIVVYRDGTIPGDAALRLRMAGARLLHRHEAFGLVVVDAPGGNVEQILAQLRSDPNVEFVVHDVAVYADQFSRLQPVAEDGPQANDSISINAGTNGRISAGINARMLAGTIAGTNAGIERINLGSPRGIQRPQPVWPIGTGAGAGPGTLGTASTGADAYYSGTAQDWAVKQVGGYGQGTPGGPAFGPWDLSMGKGVRIAVLDSGVDEQHPDIAPNLALNLTEVDQTAIPSACDDGSPQDQQGHGTWTASLAAAAIGPNTGLMVGVAPEAEILNIKVLQRMPTGSSQDPAAQCEGGQASGLLSWVVQGIEDAMAQHADVVSLSLGVLVDMQSGEGAGLRASFDRVTHAASMAGTVVVAAAGNDGFDLSNPRYLELPAQARDVLAVVASTNPNCMENLSVGGTCQDGPVTLAYYSNYGAPLGGVAAPGGSYPEGPDALSRSGQTGYVRGACSNGKPNTADGLPADGAHSFGCFGLGHQQYVQAMGTSASAPLAAGVAALLRGAHPEWDAYAVMNAMRSSAARGPGDVSTSVFNYGQVNAANALALHWKSY